MIKDIAKYFKAFNSKKIVVIGDVMTDSYIIGNVQRISPEAPVPVVQLKEKDSRLGGAANVALNIKALGAQAIMCSVIGKDTEGNAFISRAESQGISCDGIVSSSERKTTVKTRVIALNQQLLRVDEEQTDFISENEAHLLIQKFKQLIDNNNIDAVIFEDYNKGVLTPNVIQQVIAICNSNDIITCVDPKKDQFFEYKNVTLFKPNLKELKEGINKNIQWNEDSFHDAIDQLESTLKNKISLVTLSENGVFVKEGETKIHIPAHLRSISDVSGAGDTVISTATLCLAVGLPLNEVAAIANLAGGIVCEEIGVVPIDKKKLEKEVEKILIGNAT